MFLHDDQTVELTSGTVSSQAPGGEAGVQDSYKNFFRCRKARDLTSEVRSRDGNLQKAEILIIETWPKFQVKDAPSILSSNLSISYFFRSLAMTWRKWREQGLCRIL